MLFLMRKNIKQSFKIIIFIFQKFEDFNMKLLNSLKIKLQLFPEFINFFFIHKKCSIFQINLNLIKKIYFSKKPQFLKML